MKRLEDFIQETNYTPIIAHAERYPQTRKNPALISTLIEMGCLIQVNAPAFLDKREKRFAFALMKHGFVHCIGTDAHNMSERAPKLAQAKEAVKNAGLTDMWLRAENIMKDVLADRQVCVEYGKPIKKCFGFYL